MFRDGITLHFEPVMGIAAEMKFGFELMLACHVVHSSVLYMEVRRAEVRAPGFECDLWLCSDTSLVGFVV